MMNLNVIIPPHTTALDGSAYTDGMPDRRGPLTAAELQAAIADQARMHDEVDEAIAARWEAMKPAALPEIEPAPVLSRHARRTLLQGAAIVVFVLACYGTYVAYLSGVAL